MTFFRVPGRALGLRPRGYNPGIPHWSAYTAARRRAARPASCDYTAGMARDPNALGNDEWGDCAEAWTCREYEILSYKAQGQELLIPTPLCLELYHEVTGFDPNAGPPGQNPTDQGTQWQALLAYRTHTGVLLPDGSRSKLLGFFEVDPRNTGDMCDAIYEGGSVAMGIYCYRSFLDVQDGGTLEIQPGDEIVGAHAIGSGHYEAGEFWVKTWGMDVCLPMTVAEQCLMEAYCTVSPEWIRTSGLTPLGMTDAELEQAMAVL